MIKNREERKVVRRRKLNAHYETWTRPASDYGFHGEKRLLSEFHDRYLKLRYRIKTRQCEVWHCVPNELYRCILVIEDHYDINAAVRTLKQREMRKRQLRAEYIKQCAADEKKENDGIKAAAREIAVTADNCRKGKLSVAF